MYPIFKVLLLAVIAALVLLFAVLVYMPYGMLFIFFFKPVPILFVLGLSLVLCIGLKIRSWSRTLAVLGGSAAAAFAIALATQAWYYGSCQQFLSAAADLAAQRPYITTDMVFEEPAPPRADDPRVQIVSVYSEKISKLSSRKAENPPHIYANHLLMRLKFNQHPLITPRIPAPPECPLVAEMKNLAIPSKRARFHPRRGDRTYQCLTPDQRDELFQLGSIEVVKLEPTFGKFDYVARAYDDITGKLRSLVVFAFAEPSWYGFPFNAYMPITCTSDDLKWTAASSFGVLPALPPRVPALAIAAGLKAVYAEGPQTAP